MRPSPLDQPRVRVLVLKFYKSGQPGRWDHFVRGDRKRAVILVGQFRTCFRTRVSRLGSAKRFREKRGWWLYRTGCSRIAAEAMSRVC